MRRIALACLLALGMLVPSTAFAQVYVVPSWTARVCGIVASGRILFADASGNCTSDADLTFDGSILTVTGGLTLGTSGNLTGGTNTVELSNLANAMTFNVYNTTDGVNKQYASSFWSGSEYYFYTLGAGTGPARSMKIGTGVGTGELFFTTNNIPRWYIDGSGHLLSGNYNIGDGAGSSPDRVHAETLFETAAAGIYRFAGQTALTSPANGNLRITNAAGNDFGLLQLGGITDVFPALKRSTTDLQVKLADDSAFTNIVAKYKSSDGTVGITQTCVGPVTAITIKDGIITAITCP